MNKNAKTRYLIWVLAALPLLLVAVFYAKLPDQIPMQWDFGGRVGYEPKWHIWIVAGLAPVLAVVFQVMQKIDPRRRNYNKFAGPYQFFQVLMMLFVLAMIGILLAEGLRPGMMHVGKVVCLLCGLLLTAIGNMMPKFRQNYFCGFKTPWTYADEVVWARTQRLGGQLMFSAGLLGMISAFLPSDTLMFIFFFAPLCIAVLLPVIMSYIWYRARHRDDAQ